MKILTPQVRTYIYGVISAALPLLVTAGFLAPEDMQQWLLLSAAILGLGSNILAAANVKLPEKVVEVPAVQQGPTSVQLFKVGE
jgi:hypothetical protein